jgi:serine/threonine protein kinase
MGAFDFLTKPVNISKLLERVALALATGRRPAAEEAVGHYRLVRKIGSGAMGSVYEAEDTVLDRRVALKLLKPELSADSKFEAMFLKEARAAARVTHPGIVTVFEAGRHQERLFLAMELVDGVAVQELRKSDYGFRPPEAASIVLQAAEALQAAHKAGLVHRDLKPANLMLTGDKRVKILDFGLAQGVRLKGEGDEGASSFAGTLAYAAPEQIRGGGRWTRGPTSTPSGSFSTSCWPGGIRSPWRGRSSRWRSGSRTEPRFGRRGRFRGSPGRWASLPRGCCRRIPPGGRLRAPRSPRPSGPGC